MYKKIFQNCLFCRSVSSQNFSFIRKSEKIAFIENILFGKCSQKLAISENVHENLLLYKYSQKYLLWKI